jgi:uncharacterized damage-inducible protein DinB
MVDFDEHGRPEPPVAAGELETLLGFLEFHRATLEWKTRGLNAEQLRETVGSSSMTLGGLLKHLAFVEDYWFSHRLHGREKAENWASVDWAADPDWEWNSAREDSPDELRELWSEACERSRADVQSVMVSTGLDTLCVRPWPNGESPSLRWVLVHMVEEYARHNGHADLLREAIDGQRGE